MAATARFRYIGVTAEVTACQRPRCLKSGLAQTIAIMELDANGNDVGEPVLDFFVRQILARDQRVLADARALRLPTFLDDQASPVDADPN